MILNNPVVILSSFAVALAMSSLAVALPAGKLVAAGSVTMAEVSGSQTTQAGRSARPIVVSCNAGNEDWRGAACRALKAGLERRWAVALAKGDEAEAGAYLAIDIEWLRVEPTFLLARLVWRVDGGAPQVGPEIEVSVNDRDVTESDAEHLAETLVKMTPLPL